MKRILSFVSLLAITVLSVFTLAACGGGSSEPNAEELLKAFIFQEDGQEVTEDFAVVSQLTRGKDDKLKVYPMTWESNSEFVKIATEADAENHTYAVEVTRPEKDTEVTLTATLTVSEKNTATKDFKIRVVPIDVYDFSSDFKFSNGMLVTRDFNLKTSWELRPSKKTCTISWASLNEDLIKISEDGKKAIVTPTEEKTNVKLKATFSYNGNTTTKTYTVEVSMPSPERYAEITDVANIKENTPYKLGMLQVTKNQTLFATGEMKGYYGASTQEGSQAADVFFEKAGEGFKMYIKDGEKKLYISAKVKGSYINYVYDETLQSVWTWNADHKTFTTPAGEETVYIGTYSDHDTFGLSKIKHLTDKDACIARPYVKVEREVAATPVDNVPYTLMMTVKDDKQSFFTGKMDSFFGAQTDKIEGAAQVFTATVEGGYNIFFYDGQDKKFINAIQSGTHYNFKIVDADKTPTVWAWNADHKTFTTELDSKTFFIGNEGKYDKFNLMELSNIADCYAAHLFGYPGEKPIDPKPKPVEPTPEVMENIAAALAAEKDTLVQVTGRVMLIQNYKIFIQDSTGILMVKDGDATEGIEVGQTITFVGTIGLAKQKQVDLSVESFKVAETEITLTNTPKDLTTEVITEFVNNYEKHPILYGKFVGKLDAGNFVNISLPGITDKNINGSLQLSGTIKNELMALNGIDVEVTGYLAYVSVSGDKKFVQFYPESYVVKSTEDQKATAVADYVKAQLPTKTIDAKTTVELKAPFNATITATTEVAGVTVEGNKITFAPTETKAEGNIKVVVTLGELVKEFTVKVTLELASPNVKFIPNDSGVASKAEIVDPVTKDGFTFTFAGGAKNYTNEIRFYKQNTLKISSTTKKITKIVIELVDSKNGASLKIGEKAAVVEGDNAVFTFTESVNEVSILNSHESTQQKIKSIKVFYE